MCAKQFTREEIKLSKEIIANAEKKMSAILDSHAHASSGEQSPAAKALYDYLASISKK